MYFQLLGPGAFLPFGGLALSGERLVRSLGSALGAFARFPFALSVGSS